MSPVSSVGFSALQGLQRASSAMERHARTLAEAGSAMQEGGPLPAAVRLEQAYTGMLQGVAAYKAQMAPLRAGQQTFDALNSLFGPTSRQA